MCGKMFNFQRYAIHDGPGIRSVLFLFGCSLKCVWCCNPESFVPDNKFIREVESKEVISWLLEDKPYFLNSGGGLTLSGGEPLLQPEFVASLLKECRNYGIGTAIETCGEVPWSNFEAVKGLVDYYLYDIKHLDPDLHNTYTGAGNSRILQNLKRLSLNNAEIYLRVPLIPTYNMDEKQAHGIAELAREISAIGINLLPYHRFGEDKYARFGIDYSPAGKIGIISEADRKQKILEFARLIRLIYCNVVIGG